MRTRWTDRIAALFTAHDALVRAVNQLLIIVGTFAATTLARADGKWPWAFIPGFVVAFSIFVRERAGRLHRLGLTEAARKAAVWKVLELACKVMVPASIPSDLPDGTKVIRANVMRALANGRLKVWVGYNMDGDGDSDLRNYCFAAPDSGVLALSGRL